MQKHCENNTRMRGEQWKSSLPALSSHEKKSCPQNRSEPLCNFSNDYFQFVYVPNMLGSFQYRRYMQDLTQHSISQNISQH